MNIDPVEEQATIIGQSIVGLDIKETKCIMYQNVIVPTLIGEKSWRTKMKGTKYLWTKIGWTKYCIDKM